MKLEEGMYVRTKKGFVAKITYVDKETGGIDCDDFINKMNNIPYTILEGNEVEKAIKKVRHNIIELIEEGDYVNSMRVNNIAIEDGLIYLHMDADECLHEDTMLTGDDIKTVVTKEQFSSMEYKVGE